MRRGALALLVLLVLCGAMAGAAQARVFVGVGVGIPLFVPPLFVPPPPYYPPYYGAPWAYAPPDSKFSYTPPSAGPQGMPPPQSLAPPRSYGPPPYGSQGGYPPSMGDMGPDGGAQACHAGAYVCPLLEETPPGGDCTCPGHNGRRVRGQAG
jgi:hypothetical protein